MYTCFPWPDIEKKNITWDHTAWNFCQQMLLNIEVWFTDQNSEPLEIEDNDNMTLIIG